MDMLDLYIRVVKALDDIEEVAEQAARIGPETLDMWLKTLAKARNEIKKGYTPRRW